ncbi:MAG: hypothetical protein JST04_05045 [Bdellovibrionales bacterium]|nr:hypothetical protein [Bdellovibrionales bacterium]
MMILGGAIVGAACGLSEAGEIGKTLEKRVCEWVHLPKNRLPPIATATYHLEIRALKYNKQYLLVMDYDAYFWDRHSPKKTHVSGRAVDTATYPTSADVERQWKEGRDYLRFFNLDERGHADPKAWFGFGQATMTDGDREYRCL